MCTASWAELAGSTPLPSSNHYRLLAIATPCRPYVHDTYLWGSPAPFLSLSVLPRPPYFQVLLPKGWTRHLISGLPPVSVYQTPETQVPNRPVSCPPTLSLTSAAHLSLPFASVNYQGVYQLQSQHAAPILLDPHIRTSPNLCLCRCCCNIVPASISYIKST